MADIYNALNPTTPTNDTDGGNVESFIQRQKRLAGQTANTASSDSGSDLKPVVTGQSQPANPPAAQPAAQQPQMQYESAAATPVTGSGKIPDPQPTPQAQPAPQAAAPAPAQQSALTPNSPDPFAAMGGGVFVNGGWVPANHPLAQSPGAVTANGQPVNGAVASPSGGLPASYAGTQFTQYQPPATPANITNGQNDLLGSLLANPQTQSQAITDKLKQKQLEDALIMSKQLKQQNQEAAASRGFSVSGGTVSAQNRQQQDDMLTSILRGNQDIDINASTQNRTDELNVLNAVEQILNGQQSRSSDTYSNVLKGQGLQASDNQATSQGAIDRVLAQFGMSQQQAQLALQDKLGSGGLAIDSQRLGEQGREFDASNGLNILQFLEGQRQSNNGLAFNYDSLNSSNNNTMMNTIMNILNSGAK